jgi:iron-sulfur cluster assembly accessory protein
MAVVEVTQAAAEKAKQLLARNERAGDALRVRVIDGGCSGMRYELVFDGEAAPGDEESEQFGLRVVVDPESASYLEGTSVDFVDDLNESGFKIQNPRAETTCGCGESFNVV